MALDPIPADAHFNLAELHKEAGDERAALRRYSAKGACSARRAIA